MNEEQEQAEAGYGAVSELRVEEIAAVREVLRRVRVRRLEWMEAGCEFGAAVVGMALWYLGVPKLWLCFFGIWLGLGLVRVCLQRWVSRASDVNDVVDRIELVDPVLGGRLRTLHAQREAWGEMEYLQWRLLQEVRDQSRKMDWECTVSKFGIWIARQCRRLAALAFLGAWIAAIVLPKPNRKDVATQDAAAVKTMAQILPGSVEIEKGSRFTVTARLQQMQAGVSLVVTERGLEKARLPMTQGFGEPVYGVSIEEVQTDFEYWVESEAGRSERYRVGVFEYPKLERSDAVVSYPEGVEPRERAFEDARRLTVPEGATVRWKLVFNKSVPVVRLQPLKGEKAAVQELGGTGTGLDLVWELGELSGSVRGRLEIEDERGRRAKVEPEFRVEVQPNQSPKVRPLMPRNDSRFTSIEEIDFEAEATDDTGLKRWGVTVQVGARAAEEVVLGTDGKAGQTVRISRHLELESLGVKEGDSLSWFFWAEDAVARGKVRRVESDLMLGRIRAFEEQYRDGGEEEGGEGGKRGPQLLELQKQVMAATWNLKRKVSGKAEWDEEGRKGLGTVEASESKVLEMVVEKGQQEPEPERQALYSEAEQHLVKAVEALKGSESNVGRLEEALAEERLAFDVLTHVAPSVYEMKRSKSGKPGEMEERTRQMSQLEFAKQEDRYEQKRQAKMEEEEKERGELEKLLANLRALARRQEEIAERMRELEERIRNSKDEGERAAARRELKKLTEEQQNLARQLEETQQKTAQQPNDGASKETMEAAREAAQRAADAINRGALGEAGAAAARASESLRKGSDALRQQLSGRTRQAARELEQQAREMTQRQQTIADALREEAKGPKKLAAADVRKEAAEQQSRLKELQEEMQRVAESVESSEPLFSKALQEAHRSTFQNQLGGKLGVIRDAVALGRLDVARKAEQAASKDLGELTQSLEKAAAEVLGEDAQALREAHAAVDELTRALGGSGEPEGDGKNLAGISNQKKGAEGERSGGEGEKPISKGSGAEGSPQKSEPAQKGQSSSGAGDKGDAKGVQMANSGAGDSSGRGGSGGASPESEQAGSPREGEGKPARRLSDLKRAQDGETNSSYQGEPHGENVARRGGSIFGGGGGVPAQELGTLLDRLDRIESLLEQPRLRSGVARAQRVAEELRAELKRHATKPQSGELEARLLDPLVQLRDAISAELARREGREREEAVDRDPVPRRFEEAVRRYYEALGGGR